VTKIKKLPSEGGSGGSRGHSNMEHWAHTDEIKDGARTRRRLDDRDAAHETESEMQLLEFVVLDMFPIAGRGVAVTFREPQPALRIASRVRVHLAQEDGTRMSVFGSVELLLHDSANECIAVLLESLDASAMHQGSVLLVESAG
jgi:hypothetical protein